MSVLARSLLIAVACYTACGHAAENNRWSAHVPAGWKLLLQRHGDLNADSVADAVLVLEKDDPALRKPNEGLGAQTLNLNPRRFLVLLRTGADYKQMLSSDALIPSEGDAESPCLADPLLQDGDIKIDKGRLLVELNYWQSCGGWGVTHTTHIFRYEKGRMRLIGEDNSEYARNTGEITEWSANYLNGKKSITRGANELGGTTPGIYWQRIRDNAPRYLEDVNNVSETVDAE